jgi:hypothetical protein
MSMDADYRMIYNEVLSALTSGKPDVLDKYIAPDFVEHDPSPTMSTKPVSNVSRRILLLIINFSPI